MARDNGKKSGTYNPVPPSPSNFNKDVRNNEIMKAFNDMKDKTRMEVTSLFDLNTFPSSVPNPGDKMKASNRNRK